MQRRTFVLIAALVLAMTIAACGADEEGPEQVPPTPEAGTPVVEATQGVGEPVESSPFEGEGPPDDPPQPPSSDGAETAVPAAEDMSPEVVFGADIPLPEGATPVDTELAGPNVAQVTFEVPDMEGAALVEYFERTMPEAGYELALVEGGAESNTVWTFAGNGIAGTLSVVDEAEAEAPARFTIALDNPA